MTSSLVGSEMCIRDRYKRMLKAGITMDRVQQLASIETGASPEEVDFIAVSYTHLTLPTICSV
eukprot:10636607-Prorocentrum_lima.AAC.1